MDPVLFHIGWFIVGCTMLGIPAFLMDKFNTLNKNQKVSDAFEICMFIGVFQMVSVFFGAPIAAAMNEFDPLVCVLGGNLLWSIFYLMSSD